jgi:hypothetical protein
MDSYVVWPAAEHLPLRVQLAIDTLIEKLPDVVALEAPRVRARRPAELATSHSVQSRAKRRKS